jgi:signal transduction histidine kinase
MSRLIPGYMNSLRARLVLAFAAIVAVALLLVLATLPTLLDGYFAQQAARDLDRRARIMRSFLASELLQIQTGGLEAPRPILQPTEPLTPSDAVVQGLGAAEGGFLRTLAEDVAQANVRVTIAADPSRPDDIAYQLDIVLPDDFGEEGQQREDLTSDPDQANFQIEDTWWTQAGTGADSRLVTVILSRPFTFRAQTLETIVGVMFIAAAIALAVAVIASIIFANRLTRPIRRLTGAARELSEGHLGTRVGPVAGAPEMSELTAAFNNMADRLQASIEFIRRDRDRSRDFLADVSHELRTPIAALRTFNELLTEGAVVDDATRQEFLDQSRQQIERLDWLATNLLELSKLDSGLVLLDLRPDDLRAVVENAIQQAQPSADRKGVELMASVPAEPVRQRHDPQRMGQVLANLIGNAIKFTPAGGRVEVRLSPAKSGAEMRVADSGEGIDPAELPFVFERFYRGARASQSRAAGSGLGLSIVRSIVEMHNGRVAITSSPGAGTQVSVFLPRDVSVSSPAPVPS